MCTHIDVSMKHIQVLVKNCAVQSSQKSMWNLLCGWALCSTQPDPEGIFITLGGERGRGSTLRYITGNPITLPNWAKRLSSTQDGVLFSTPIVASTGKKLIPQDSINYSWRTSAGKRIQKCGSLFSLVLWIFRQKLVRWWHMVCCDSLTFVICHLSWSYAIVDLKYMLHCPLPVTKCCSCSLSRHTTKQKPEPIVWKCSHWNFRKF